jgi:predicted nucleic acid-binding Zn ribbon protein
MGRKETRLAEWQLKKERFQLNTSIPHPRADREERFLGDILKGLKGDEVRTAQLPAVLCDRWALIVGEQIAKHTQPIQLHGSRLTVTTDHPGWLAQVKRLPKSHLIKKIATLPNAPIVTDVRFILEPNLRTYKN